jgi:hypothetical protein
VPLENIAAELKARGGLKNVASKAARKKKESKKKDRSKDAPSRDGKSIGLNKNKSSKMSSSYGTTNRNYITIEADFTEIEGFDIRKLKISSEYSGRFVIRDIDDDAIKIEFLKIQ